MQQERFEPEESIEQSSSPPEIKNTGGLAQAKAQEEIPSQKHALSESQPKTAEEIETLRKEIAGYRNYLLGFCLGLVNGDRALAEDLAQETIRRALEHANEFRGKANVRSWLTSILINAIRDAYRRRKTDPLAQIMKNGQESEENLREYDISGLRSHERSPENAIISRLDVRKALKKVKEIYRIPLELQLQSFKPQDIADRLGITVEAAKSRLHHGQEQLKEILSRKSPPFGKGGAKKEQPPQKSLGATA